MPMYVHIVVIFTDGTEIPLDVEWAEMAKDNGHLSLKFVADQSDTQITYPLSTVARMLITCASQPSRRK